MIFLREQTDDHRGRDSLAREDKTVGRLLLTRMDASNSWGWKSSSGEVWYIHNGRMSAVHGFIPRIRSVHRSFLLRNRRLKSKWTPFTGVLPAHQWETDGDREEQRSERSLEWDETNGPRERHRRPGPSSTFTSVGFVRRICKCVDQRRSRESIARFRRRGWKTEKHRHSSSLKSHDDAAADLWFVSNDRGENARFEEIVFKNDRNQLSFHFPWNLRKKFSRLVSIITSRYLSTRSERNNWSRRIRWKETDRGSFETDHREESYPGQWKRMSISTSFCTVLSVKTGTFRR